VPDVFPPDPHTLSIVRRGDVPRTIEEVLTCPACTPFFEAHDPGNDQQPPFNYVVNVGKSTAARGTSLDFICAIHPWMQGKLKVT
jgi:hypothetical protein